MSKQQQRRPSEFGQTGAGTNRRSDLISDVVEHAPDAIWVLEARSDDPAQWRILYANAGFERAYGITPEKAVGMYALDLFRDRARPEEIDHVVSRMKRRLPFRTLHLREREHDGAVWLEINHQPKIEDDRVLWFAVGRDVTETILMQRQSRRLSRALDEVHEAIAVSVAIDKIWRFDYVNRAFTDMLGYQARELIGRSWRPLFARESDLKQIEDLEIGLLSGQRAIGELLFRRSDGSIVTLAASATPFREEGSADRMYAVTLLRDVTHARQEERLLREQAVRDPLTGLQNRREFQRLAQNAIDMTPKGERAHVMIFADLDGFKGVNDTYGHDEGDRVLMAVAQILRRTLLPSDDVARWGGDEFAAILYFCAPEQAVIRANAFLEALGAAGECRGVGASIGIVAIRADSTAVDLMRRADRLVYRAKASGRNRVMLER
jgi:diguanylate cyclase (GGDEF)-like protein/PAS domain S-box-containing protein